MDEGDNEWPYVANEKEMQPNIIFQDLFFFLCFWYDDDHFAILPKNWNKSDIQGTAVLISNEDEINERHIHLPGYNLI